MKRLTLLVIAAALVAGCSGEGKPDAAAKPRIALIYKATTNPFFQAME